MKNFFKKFKDLKPPIIEVPKVVKTPLEEYAFDKEVVYYQGQPFFKPSKRDLKGKEFTVLGRYFDPQKPQEQKIYVGTTAIDDLAFIYMLKPEIYENSVDGIGVTELKGTVEHVLNVGQTVSDFLPIIHRVRQYQDPLPAMLYVAHPGNGKPEQVRDAVQYGPETKSALYFTLYSYRGNEFQVIGNQLYCTNLPKPPNAAPLAINLEESFKQLIQYFKRTKERR